jgi:hypothetical protein
MKGDDSQDKKKLKRLLPTLLIAGAMTVPSLGAQPQEIGDLVMKAERSGPTPTVIDSQAGWQDKSGDRGLVPNWSEVTWGQVVWAKQGGPFDDY